ncbi:MAG: tripartite tricarboxylate transporter substrate binding protein [Azospirillaceae bacterium]
MQKLMMAGLAATMVSGVAITAHAQDWPSEPVTIYVAYSPGGANSNVTRLLADELTERMGQSFVVEHRTGASGRVAATHVASQPADGTVFFMGAPGILVLNHLLYNDVPYSMEDFSPVSLIGILPYILLVNNDLPATSVEELVAYAEAYPGELNHGATGGGPNFVQELFAFEAGIEFENLLYQGTPPAIQDLMRGDIQFMLDLIPGVTSQVDAGQVRALAVSSPNRSQAYPDLPTVVEAGVDGVDATNWFGIVAPAGTPEEIVQRMSAELADIVNDPEVAQELLGMGVEPVGSTPEEFAEFIASEQERWATVAAAAGIEPQ